MKNKILKSVSLKVLISLGVLSVIVIIAVCVLNSKTKELRKEINEIMEADSVRPMVLEVISQSTDLQESGESGSSDVVAVSSEVASEETPEESSGESILDESEQESGGDESTENTVSESSGDILQSSDTEKSSSDEEAEDTAIAAGSEAATSEVVQTTSSTAQQTAVTTAVSASTTAVPTTTVSTTAAPTTAAPTTAAPATASPETSATAVETTQSLAEQSPTPIAISEDMTYITSELTTVFKNRLLADINSLRTSLGLGTLTEDVCLQSGAIVRAKELVVNWSHTRPNGDRGMYVIEGCGGYYADAVNCIRNGTNQIYALGENCAVSYSYSNYSGLEQEVIDLADEVYQNWVNSPTHYDNLVYSGYTKIGLGLNVTMDEDIYHAFWVVALFCNK